MGQSIKLLSTTSRVESPFIEVNIGGYVFGKYSRQVNRFVSPQDGFTHQVKEVFPNLVKSLNIQKLNGQVNTYTLTLVYVISAGDDPNKIDKILSSISTTRKMSVSYGDCNSPTFMYKNEEVLITSVSQNVNINSSSITYTIVGVSSATLLTKGTYYFPAFKGKPSDKIEWLLQNKDYGLQEIFYGMHDMAMVKQECLIDKSDKDVSVEAKMMSPFDYLTYLVSCMVNVSDDDKIDGTHKYIISCFDDVGGKLGGPYFKVQMVMNNVQESTSIDTFEVDIGFPDADLVTSFTIETNDGYALLYNYQGNIDKRNYVYRVNENGGFDYEYSPNIAWDKNYYSATQQSKNWWAQMTQFPISATLTIKGLLRPTILMSYIKINTYFYGRKHSSSGLYIITKQMDQIDASGYRSTLSLTRIKGEDDI